MSFTREYQYTEWVCTVSFIVLVKWMYSCHIWAIESLSVSVQTECTQHVSVIPLYECVCKIFNVSIKCNQCTSREFTLDEYRTVSVSVKKWWLWKNQIAGQIDRVSTQTATRSLAWQKDRKCWLIKQLSCWVVSRNNHRVRPDNTNRAIWVWIWVWALEFADMWAVSSGECECASVKTVSPTCFCMIHYESITYYFSHYLVKYFIGHLWLCRIQTHLNFAIITV